MQGFKSKTVVLGSPTIYNSMLHSMAGLFSCSSSRDLKAKRLLLLDAMVERRSGEANGWLVEKQVLPLFLKAQSMERMKVRSGSSRFGKNIATS